MFSLCPCEFSLGTASSHSPKTCKLRVRLISHSKFPVGVSVFRCLCLYVNPAVNWQCVQVVPRLCLKVQR